MHISKYRQVAKIFIWKFHSITIDYISLYNVILLCCLAFHVKDMKNILLKKSTRYKYIPYIGININNFLGSHCRYYIAIM